MHTYPHLNLGMASPEMKYLSVVLVTAAAILLYRLLSYDVRRAWIKYGLREPIAKGDNEYFDRLYRIQMNTVEHLIFFLPSLWICAVYWDVMISAWLGFLWLVGRVWYAIDYFKTPGSRAAALAIRGSMFVAGLLFVLGVIGALYKLPLHFSIPIPG